MPKSIFRIVRLLLIPCLIGLETPYPQTPFARRAFAQTASEETALALPSAPAHVIVTALRRDEDVPFFEPPTAFQRILWRLRYRIQRIRRSGNRLNDLCFGYIPPSSLHAQERKALMLWNFLGGLSVALQLKMSMREDNVDIPAEVQGVAELYPNVQLEDIHYLLAGDYNDVFHLVKTVEYLCGVFLRYFEYPASLHVPLKKEYGHLNFRAQVVLGTYPSCFRPHAERAA